jgi:hypothetical protein
MKSETCEALPFGIAAAHEQLPVQTITQKDVDAAHDLVFGSGRENPRCVPLTAFADSEWSRAIEQFYRERIVHVTSNNVMLLRFAYDYEVDLDRIKTERDLLAWTLHLCGKTWMNTERISHFIEAVTAIKHFRVAGL